MSLDDLLVLETTGADTFRAAASEYRHRPNIYGGQLAAQAIAAAATTVDPKLWPHSLHLSFVGAGRLGEPVDHLVERARDGRSFSARLVRATQSDGHLVTAGTVSFHADEPGADYDTAAPQVPRPEEGVVGDELDFFQGLDVRELPGSPLEGRLPEVVRYWVRLDGPSRPDPVASACRVAFVSDMRTGTAAVIAGQFGEAGTGMMTSLDHALWFHRPAPADGWLLVSVQPVNDAGARGLVLGTVHDEAGRHCATFTQELLLRPPRRSVPPSSS